MPRTEPRNEDDKKETVANSHKGSFGEKHENVIKIHSGEVCITSWIY